MGHGSTRMEPNICGSIFFLSKRKSRISGAVPTWCATTVSSVSHSQGVAVQAKASDCSVVD